MKKSFLLLSFVFLLLIPLHSQAQFGVSYHLSFENFIGFNYEINERMLPELRLGVNRAFEDIFIEGTFTYQFINEDDVEAYAGGGIRVGDFNEGIVLPVGLNLYPFDEKKFGFLIEAAPILLFDDGGDALRGSFGIRYRFLE